MNTIIFYIFDGLLAIGLIECTVVIVLLHRR